MQKKYDIIYADPPWRYNFSQTEKNSIEAHYNSMPLEDIKNLYVPSKENCILFLWGTAPKIMEALDVMSAWGFEYKTQAVWDKLRTGIGYWFLGQHEILLIGTRGKMSPPIPMLRGGSVFKERKTTHSKKPKCVRQWIEESFAYLHDKIELFARNKTEGWDVWGNEVDCDIKLEVVTPEEHVKRDEKAAELSAAMFAHDANQITIDDFNDLII